MLEYTFNPFPILTTDRLVLRSLTKEDEEDFFNLRQIDSIGEFINRAPLKTRQEIKEKIAFLLDGTANNKWITWMITQKGSNQMIGSICLWNIDPENYRAEIGYELHPNFQGLGIMGESVKAVLQYGFNEMGLHSVEGSTMPSNIQSIKVMERAGFVREAYFKEVEFFEGKFWDRVVYSKLVAK